MTQYNFKSEFEIGQRVFFPLPNSEVHVVTDIVFWVRSKVVKYEVMDNDGLKNWYLENELTAEQKFS